jgi:membrane protein
MTDVAQQRRPAVVDRARRRPRRAGSLRTRAAALARATWARLQARDVMLLTSGLTFYAAIAVIPLLLLAVHLAGLVVGHDTLQGLVAALAAYAPAHLGFRDALVELAARGASLEPWALAFALVPATTYGEGLLRAFHRIAEQPRRAPGVRGRLRALSLLATLPALVLVGLGAVAVLPDLLGTGAGATALGVYLTFWVVWLVAAGLLAVTYRFFSPTPLSRRALLWGTLGTGSFLAGMSLGWVLVLQYGITVGQAYGGSELLGAGVLFVVYLYLVQLVCLVGYAATLELSRRRRPSAPRSRAGA